MKTKDENIVSLEGISKTFGGVHALNNVNFNLTNEVHSIVGHNGAGKSTLVKILMGALKPDEGKIFIDGKQVSFSSPREAMQNGIAMVWQELNNFPNLSITENMMMGRFIRRKNGAVNWTANHEQCAQHLKRLKIDINPRVMMGSLPLSLQQLVEFAKVLSYDPKVLILDEPTSALSFSEQEVLYEKVKTIKEEGIAVVYISHKLEEIMTLSDRVTVLRDGKKIFTKQMEDLDKDAIVEAITGNTMHKVVTSAVRTGQRRIDIEKSKVVMDVKNLSMERVLNDVSFSLHRGEILGITGVSGSGITPLGQILFGVLKNYEGEIILNEKKVDYKLPMQAVKAGVAYVSKDRKGDGIIPNMSVGDNIVLSTLSKINKFGFIEKKKRKKIIDEIMDTIDLLPRRPDMTIGSLSGGNQQKGMIARWISNQSEVLIFDEPTRGVDVGAIKKIYELIRSLADKGLSVIVISSEFEEIHSEVDRILVFNKGRVIGEFDPFVDPWEKAFVSAIE